MGVYSRSTLFTITYYLFLAVFVTFKNITMVLGVFFFALPLLKHVIHISRTLTVPLKGVGYSISAPVETEVL